MTREPTPIRSLRSALPGLRAALVGFALLLAGMQLALQAHLIEHDLLPVNHEVCEQCVIAKSAPPPPVVAAVQVLPPLALPLPSSVAPPATASIPLVERNRGPPSAA